jgi:hypothetical protein
LDPENQQGEMIMQTQHRQQSHSSSQNQGRRKPIHEIRFGTVKAAIWENQSHEGATWHNVTVNRAYKDGEEWRSADSFGRDDLLLLAKAVDLAHTWICEQRQRNAAGDGNR